MNAVIPIAHTHISSMPDHDAARKRTTPALAHPQALRRSFSKINPNANRSESNSNNTMPCIILRPTITAGIANHFQSWPTDNDLIPDSTKGPSPNNTSNVGGKPSSTSPPPITPIVAIDGKSASHHREKSVPSLEARKIPINCIIPSR